MLNKKLCLIYNPKSGEKKFISELDSCIEVFQSAGYLVHIYRSDSVEGLENFIKNTPSESYDAIVCAGGDGTVNIVINALMNNYIDTPLGIIPRGTANDFAKYLRYPDSAADCCRVISSGYTKKIDLGKANDKYFINVCGGGLLTNVSQNIDTELKNTLGKLAYYIKGIEQLPSFAPIPVKITNSEEVIDTEIYFFLTLNGSGAGGFDKLVPGAKADDGYIDFIAIKAKPLVEMAVLFLKMLRGDHLDDSGVIYFKDKYVKIELKDEDSCFKETDVDGESGPHIPVEIKVVPNCMRIFCLQDIDIT